jgi:hypothetical protein
MPPPDVVCPDPDTPSYPSNRCAAVGTIVGTFGSFGPSSDRTTAVAVRAPRSTGRATVAAGRATSVTAIAEVGMNVGSAFAAANSAFR